MKVLVVLPLTNGTTHSIVPFMVDRLTIDKAGRVILPKRLRDALQLGAGDALELETDGDRITLRPVRPRPALEKEHGIWVFRSGEPLAASVADETLRQVREGRGTGSSGPRR